jgi:hypothetical protein
VQRSFALQQSKRHPHGFVDRQFVHIPYDTIPRLQRARPDLVLTSARPADRFVPGQSGARYVRGSGLGAAARDTVRHLTPDYVADGFVDGLRMALERR